MKKISTKLCAICLLCALCVGFAACEMKWDKNGDLDGMWQLTEWRNTTKGTVEKTKADGLFFSVQQDMIRINKQSDEGYYLSLFTKRNDSLIIQSPVYWPKDSMCNISALAPFGVPGHGRFHIDMLTSENMVLSSDTAIISFRKY